MFIQLRAEFNSRRTATEPARIQDNKIRDKKQTKNLNKLRSLKFKEKLIQIYLQKYKLCYDRRLEKTT
jgi:hypothetical protein